jgi:hypothetical protein
LWHATKNWIENSGVRGLFFEIQKYVAVTNLKKTSIEMDCPHDPLCNAMQEALE